MKCKQRLRNMSDLHPSGDESRERLNVSDRIRSCCCAVPGQEDCKPATRLPGSDPAGCRSPRQIVSRSQLKRNQGNGAVEKIRISGNGLQVSLAPNDTAVLGTHST